ncbi:MAG: hypothetical protein ACLTBU_00155 [Zhenhengia sp.]
MEGKEVSPSTYQSIVMTIKIEPNGDEIQEEEIIKIANSTYKIN